MMQRYSVLFLGALLLALWTQPAHAQLSCGTNDLVCDLKLTNDKDAQEYITVYPVEITPTTNRWFETRKLSPGSDTVMLLVDAWSGFEKIYCQDDDGGSEPRASKIVVGSNGCNVSDRPGSNTYNLVILSYDNDSGGRASLYVDGNPLIGARKIKDISFGGRFWNTGLNQHTLQTTTVSKIGAQPVDTVLLLGWVILSPTRPFINYGHYNDNDNLAPHSRKTANFGTPYGLVVVGRHLPAIPSIIIDENGRVVRDTSPPKLQGSVKVYKNESTTIYTKALENATGCANDADCDGLGDKLEQALETCPFSDPSQMSTDPNCKNVHNGKDTDGDGIPDSWEVFGRASNGEALNLPRFGADPRHKDVFLEVDRDEQNKSPPITKEVIQKIIDGYSKGPAGPNYLNNPDGSPGIRLHFDTRLASHGKLGLKVPQLLDKYEPKAYYDSNGAYLGSYGDWGGGDLYDSNGNPSMSAVRHGIWRLIDNAKADAGLMIKSAHDPSTFAHELGHQLGLQHTGNLTKPLPFSCLPHYDSVMNYAYAYTPNEVRFSKGSFPALNPSKLNEAKGLLAPNSGVSVNDYQYLKGAPFSFDVRTNGAIDWNRNGNASETNAKAYLGVLSPIVVSPYLGEQFLNCPGGGASKSIFLHEAQLSKSTPGFSLPAGTEPVGGVSLVAFNQKIYLSALLRPTNAGNAPGTLYLREQTSPTSWGSWRIVDSNIDVSNGIGTLGHTPVMVPVLISGVPRLFFFYRISNQIRYRTMAANGDFSVSNFPLEETSGNPIATSKELSVYQATPNSFRLFFLEQGGQVLSKTFTNGVWGPTSAELDPNEKIILAHQVPTVASEPSGGIFLFLPSQPSGNVYIYQRVKLKRGKAQVTRWKLIGDDTKPSRFFFTGAKEVVQEGVRKARYYPATLHRIAVVYIAENDSEKGFHLWLHSTSGDQLHRYVSSPTFPGASSFHRLNLIIESGPSVIGSPSLLHTPANNKSYLKGALNSNDGSANTPTPHILYLPHADGIIDLSIPSHNDWKVMARFICRNLAHITTGAGGGGRAFCNP